MCAVAVEMRPIARDDGTIEEFEEYLRIRHGVTKTHLRQFAEFGITIRKCPCGCGRWQLAAPRIGS